MLLVLLKFSNTRSITCFWGSKMVKFAPNRWDWYSLKSRHFGQFSHFGPKIDHQMINFEPFGQIALLGDFGRKSSDFEIWEEVQCSHWTTFIINNKINVHCDTVNFRRGNRPVAKNWPFWSIFDLILAPGWLTSRNFRARLKTKYASNFRALFWLSSKLEP